MNSIHLSSNKVIEDNLKILNSVLEEFQFQEIMQVGYNERLHNYTLLKSATVDQVVLDTEKDVYIRKPEEKEVNSLSFGESTLNILCDITKFYEDLKKLNNK